MTDMQILAISLATFPTALLVLVGILLNNSRAGVLRVEMRGSLNDLRVELRGSQGELRDTLRAEAAKNHSELLAKFADLAHRIERRFEALEQQRWKP